MYRPRRKPGHRGGAGKAGRMTWASRAWVDYMDHEYECDDWGSTGSLSWSSGTHLDAQQQQQQQGDGSSSGGARATAGAAESSCGSSARGGGGRGGSTRGVPAGGPLNATPRSDAALPFTRCGSSNSYAALDDRVGEPIDSVPRHAQWVMVVDDTDAIEAAFDASDVLACSDAVRHYAGARGRVRLVDHEDLTAQVVFGDGKALWFPPECLCYATKKQGGAKVRPDPSTGGWVHFHLLRHGESSWNTIGRIQGQRDTMLTARGRKQAAHAREVFTEGALKGVRLDAVLVSPLKRAVDTAEAAVLQGEHAALHVCEDERLMEIDVGEYEARYASDPEIAEFLRTMDADTPFPNGESRADVACRARQCLLDTVFLGSNIAVVTHGGVIKALVHSVEGTTAFLPPVDNCSLTTVSYHPLTREWDVTYHNTTRLAAGPHATTL